MGRERKNRRIFKNAEESRNYSILDTKEKLEGERKNKIFISVPKY